MKLQKLDIQGFKSFADRTTITFGKGITGVVGPNGCGKSNIVDAIRWVMGEQSPRHLRGGSMQDVIFNGSDVRGPMGMAEVTLTFENDGKGVPPEYSHFGEIQVTRRLYRDGDSDYEINKTSCRLKDITELFLGTGIGTRAYSIIEQGRVSEIVKSKPEDRRTIIEEAAGITKYKARKAAAERKMEATRQNLQRIDDVTGEINKRLGSLRRQARKAEKYRQLKSELRTLELHQAAHSFLELTNAIAFDRDQQTAIADAVAADEARVKTLEDEIEGKRAGLSTEERALGEKQGRLYEIESHIALAEQSAEHAQKEYERSKKRDEEAAAEVAHLQEQRLLLEGMKQEIARSAEELVAEAETDEGALTTAQAELDELKRSRSGDAGDVEQLRRTVMGRATDAAKAASDVANLERSLDELKQRRAQIGGEHEQLRAETEEARAKIAAFTEESTKAEDERKAADQKKQDLERSLKDQRRELEKKGQDYGKAKDKLQERKSRLQSLKEIHARYEQSPEGVKALMKREGKKSRGLFADLFEAPSHLELPLESVLGDRLQAVVVETQRDAQEAIDFLRDKGKGRAEVLVAGCAAALKVPQLSSGTPLVEGLKLDADSADVVRAVLGRTILVDDAAAAVAAWTEARELGLTLVTAQGEVFTPECSARGGTAAGAEKGVLKQKREIRELEEEVAAKTAELDAQKLALDEAAQAVKAADEDLKKTGEQLNKLHVKKAELKQQLGAAKDVANRLEQRLSRIDGDAAKLDEGVAAQAKRLDERRAQLDVYEQERKALDEKLALLSTTLAERDRVIAEKQEQVTTLRVRASSLTERKANLEKTREQNERTEKDIEARLTRLAKQIEDGVGEREALTKLEQDARASIGTYTSERGEVKRVLDEARAAYEQASERVRMMEHEARAARATLDEARQKRDELSLRVREHELELDALVDRCIERHRVTPQEVLFDYHMLPVPPESSRERFQELERQIDALGPINLTAIDECAELEKRYEFLKTQSDDLTHALAQLEKAIVKINRTTKKRFQEAYEGINERFQQVFPRLFKGGGKAWLALTDPNDMLTTGVEIYAQPPGKKLGSVALMSGGEQALTAVSLIFAIFLLKPSPFCLLDEVDAPLDEANVGRFNDMVRDVSAISQFIVITHNKRTMEVADHLYGVTMEEPGVSKTVNVRIQ